MNKIQISSMHILNIINIYYIITNMKYTWNGRAKRLFH